MAVYIEIVRSGRTDTHSEYTFASSDWRSGARVDRVGRLSISHETGVIETLEAMPGDESEFNESRARRTLTLAWQSGVMPDRTCWAS